MFFILSKTLNYLAQPLVIIVIMMIVAWWIKNERYKRILSGTAFFLLIFLSNQFISNELLRLWEIPIQPLATIEKKYDYGILLTGITKTEATPRDRVYFARGADRATHTLQLYKLGIIRKIIISGGNGRLIDIGVREADELATFMIMAGVAKEDVIIENRSDNTHESAVEVKNLLATMEGPQELLLITSNFHMRRSVACFTKAGIKVDPFPTDPLAFNRKFTIDVLIIPKLDALGNWQTLIKEWVGFAAYWVAGFI